MTKLVLLLLFALALPVRAQVCPPAGCTLACPGQLDDQGCYETPRKNSLNIPLTVTDRFTTLAATAVNFHRLCAPTNKNDDCPGCPGQPDHYLGLTLDKISGTLPTNTLTLAYQFGTVTGTLAQPGFLLVPAGKSLTPPAPPPVSGLRSYNCYRLDGATGNVSAAIHTVDQFVTNDYALQAKGPWTACFPANVDGTDPSAPADPNLFLCNLVEDTHLPFNQLTVFVNAFLVGPKIATITRFDDLCMPATIP
jgi:hypothetical protein